MRALLQWPAEYDSPGFHRALGLEGLSTFLLVWYTLSSAVFSQDGGLTVARELESAVVAGCTVACLCYIFSTSHFNPAVSISFAIIGRITPARAAAYVVAQCTGSTLAAFAVRVLSPTLFAKIGGGVNKIQPLATSTEALGGEFAMVFVLLFAALATSETLTPCAPLTIGSVAALGCFVLIPVDACSMNPARSFGVAAAAGTWDDQMVFWAGPCLGGAASSLLYDRLFSARHNSAGKAA